MKERLCHELTRADLQTLIDYADRLGRQLMIVRAAVSRLVSDVDDIIKHVSQPTSRQFYM